MSTIRIAALLFLIGVSACSREPEQLFTGTILATEEPVQEPVETPAAAEALSEEGPRPHCKGVMIGGGVVALTVVHTRRDGCWASYGEMALALYLEDNPDKEVAHIAFDDEGQITTVIVRKRS